MCAYCMIADHTFRFNPPWHVPDNPLVPQPMPGVTINPWAIEQLREYEQLLLRVKALEDQLGCPCEPAKADYLTMFRQRIEALEKAAAEKGGQP